MVFWNKEGNILILYTQEYVILKKSRKFMRTTWSSFYVFTSKLNIILFLNLRNGKENKNFLFLIMKRIVPIDFTKIELFSFSKL